MSDVVGTTKETPKTPKGAEAAEKESLMAQQNAAAQSKFGGMQKKGPLAGKNRAFFDSADHFTGKQTGKKQAVAVKSPQLEGVGEETGKK